ncbi:hypothetical protein [Sphingomonas sp. RIT328]|uniref:hypothetical protein n=1 Tax=Sphingomonas sp. RIT328 TaxID=1470591 RepID=UPI0004475CF7|nr:hypothetical protein [Sphingomonas sp. RIT328]EZP55789.1 hypothetical protein BW41_00868 [Sphingomonas sp. RIT328]
MNAVAAPRPVFPDAGYLYRETAISVAINAVLSLIFFLLVFGTPASVRVAGAGGYGMDFVPQSLMIALMASLVPGAIAAAKLRRAGLAAAEARAALLRRSLATALLGAGVGAAIGWLLALLLPVAAIPLVPALFARILYGALLAAIVTPIGLRRALRRPYRTKEPR